MIRVIDYGVGNVHAFLTVFKRLGIDAEAARTPQQVESASRLILPGVGAFDSAMELLNRSGLRESLDEAVLGRKVPVLGVCVGMQMLAAGSDEGKLPGLDWIPGRVRALASVAPSLPTPHMGWNDVSVQPAGQLLFARLSAAPRFYFLHSFFFDCKSPEHVAATVEYGVRFPCAVSAGHVHGIQCHPEKSHQSGTQLIRNFAELA